MRKDAFSLRRLPGAAAARPGVRLPWALGGFALTAIMLAFYYKPETLFVDTTVWDRVGDEVRAGVSPYYHVEGAGGFFFAPPWAVGFALVSWLPMPVLSLGILLSEILALRYIAGSWLRIGYLGWFPLVAAELTISQFNLVIAAVVLAALRGDPRGSIALGFAKLSPFLAIDPRDWRRTVPIGLGLVAATLPFAGLWGDWAHQLTSSYGATVSDVQLQIPFLPRLLVALVLIGLRKPWARVVAVFLAVPALYPVSAVVLLALFPLASDLRPARVRPAGGRPDASRG